MRIDLPCCGFKNCRHNFDGNCTRKEKYEKCYHRYLIEQLELNKGKWNFVGDQMFECTGCGIVYSQDQFEHMKTKTNDPDFPRYCPNCGSYNGGKEDE